MLGKAASAFITVFWLCMMTLLVHREILPAVRAAQEAAKTPGYSLFDALGEETRVSCMGIYLGKRRVGYTFSSVEKRHDEILIQSKTDLKLNLSPAMMPAPDAAAGLHMRFLFKARILERKLLDFRLTVHSPPGSPPVATIDAYPVGKTLCLRIRTAEGTRKEEVPFNAQNILSSDLAPMLALPKLKIGKRWLMRTIDPMTYKVRAAWAEVVARDSVTINDTEYDAFLIAVPYGSHEVKIWATPDGEILKQKVFGFTFLKEEPAAEPGEEPSP